jgi:hypothetical protein
VSKGPKNNIAYIDAANLHRATLNLGWKLDYRRFRIWLADKYDIGIAYMFIGFISGNREVYSFLQEVGYVLIYKEVVYNDRGNAKGNCDADLVLKAAIDFYEKRFKQAVIVTSDGDYASPAKFLKQNNSFRILISPSNQCSSLLKNLNIPIEFLSTQKELLAMKIT